MLNPRKNRRRSTRKTGPRTRSVVGQPNESVGGQQNESVGGQLTQPTAEHWKGYSLVYCEGRRMAKCLNCLRNYSNTAKSRMENHREICGTENIDALMHEIPDNASLDIIKVEPDVLHIDTQSLPDPIIDLQTLSPPNSCISRTFNSEDSEMLDSVMPNETVKIDALVAEFFYACNIPFRIVESSYFKNLLKTLKPSYNPPHRQLLAGKLLDKTHVDIEKRNSELICKMDKRMSLLVDVIENSSTNQHYVVMMLATSNEQRVFLESFNFPATHEANGNLFDNVEKSIALATERYGAKIYALVSNNTYNMQNIDASCQSLGLLHTICNAHSANLLAGDILKLPVYKKTMKQLRYVQKDCRRIGLSNRLSDIGGNKLIWSSTTRWTSQRDLAEYLIENLSTIKSLITVCYAELKIDKKQKKLKNKGSRLLFNVDFNASVKSLLELLNPVAELIKFCQKSTTSAAEASEKWLELLNDGPNDLRPFLQFRLQMSNILNTVTLTANYLHPVYRGQRLNDVQTKEVNHYLVEKLEAEELEACRQFIANEGIFTRLNQKKITSAKTYWHYAGELGSYKLAAFASDYLKIPASTAQLKRIFSNWSIENKDTANKISDELSKKLLDIYFTFRTSDEMPDDESGSDGVSDDED